MRRRLPDRRRAVTLDLEHGGSVFTISLGYDAGSRVREIFVSGSKSGSGLEGLLNDAAIAISLALQHGVEPAALPLSMGRLGRSEEPTSIIGAVCDLLAAHPELNW